VALAGLLGCYPENLFQNPFQSQTPQGARHDSGIGSKKTLEHGQTIPERL
jgi:hypothetical protein